MLPLCLMLLGTYCASMVSLYFGDLVTYHINIVTQREGSILLWAPEF